MDALLGLLGLFGLIIFLVLTIISGIKKNGKFKKVIIGMGLSFVLLIAGCSMAPTDTSKTISGSAVNSSEGTQVPAATTPSEKESTPATDAQDSTSTAPTNTTPEAPATPEVTGKLKVHYIDVGQADAILIQDGSVNMLIDAGNNADANTVINYIRKQGISRLDYVIGTHPHEDHIGGLDGVINTFNIGKIYMPKVSNTTKTYSDVLNAIKNKGLKVTTPVTGSSLKLNSAEAVILAPNSSSYEELNNQSIVIRLTFGSNSFLFTGDAEEVSENEMLNKGLTLSADVIKVGHHGSSSSTTASFLSRVNPKYAVIMLGKDNTYGHPHKGTMDRLKAKAITVFRTDENGTIVATSDGKTVSFNVKPASYSYGGTGSSGSTSTGTAPAPSTSTGTTTTGKVYVDASGKGLIKGNINSSKEKIYHLPGGAYYDKTIPEEWFKTEAEAKAAGYRPSSR